MLLNHARRTRFNKDALLLCILPTIAVFIALMAVSFWVWVTARQNLIRDQETLASQHVTNLQDLLVSRLKSYEEVLRGSAALFETTKQPSAQDLHALFQNYNVQSRYPGVRAIGYAPFLPLDGTGNSHVPILYIEPRSETNVAAVGFDMYADPARKVAFDLSGQKGQVVITGKITPRPSAAAIIGPAFQMYFPVYDGTCAAEATNRTDCTLTGFVFAGFRANELVDSTIAGGQINDNFSLYDGTDLTNSKLLYASKGYDEHAPESLVAINMYSRTWSLVVQVPKTELLSQLHTKPTLILIAGIGLSLSSSAFICILLLQRVRSLRLSKDNEVQMVKDDLLALAAHQLRTPATAVKQYIIMALEGYGGDLLPAQSKLVEKAYENNERQLRTVNEMLYVANADAGKLRLIPRSVELVQLTREAIEEQSSNIKEKRHRLVLHLPSTPLHYDADELYLRMAISNLISNAIKYTPEAGKIEVSLNVTPRNIRIKVSDNGVGISKKQLPELFKKFSRLDNPLSIHAMGNGLGLYLARRVVELHGGRIKVTSVHTVGSEFTILLPRLKSEPPDKTDVTSKK